MRTFIPVVILGLLAVVHSTPVTSVTQIPAKAEDEEMGVAVMDGFLVSHFLTTESPKRNTTVQVSQPPSPDSTQNDMMEGSGEESTTPVLLQLATTTQSVAHTQSSSSDSPSPDYSSPSSLITLSVPSEDQTSATTDHTTVSTTTDPAVTRFDFLTTQSTTQSPNVGSTDGDALILDQFSTTTSSMTSSSNTDTSTASTTSSTTYGSNTDTSTASTTSSTTYGSNTDTSTASSTSSPAYGSNTDTSSASSTSSTTYGSNTDSSTASSTSTAAFPKVPVVFASSEGSGSGSGGESGSGMDHSTMSTTTEETKTQTTSENPIPSGGGSGSGEGSGMESNTTVQEAMVPGGRSIMNIINELALEPKPQENKFSPPEPQNKGHSTPGWIIIVGFIVGVAALVLLCVAIATRDKWNGPRPSKASQLETKTNSSNQQRELEMETFLHQEKPRENGKAAEYTVIPLDELPENHSSH